MMPEKSSFCAEVRYLHARIGAPVRQLWNYGPERPVLRQSEVHVWRVSLDAPGPQDLEDALSAHDRVKAGRFRFETDRRRFRAARASLRLILGRYLQAAPAALQFEFGAYGKPRIVDEQNSQGIRFNLSHSRELALIAIARGREVGVDIEFVRPDFATDEVATRFFSANELNQLRAVPPWLKIQSFFNCWTRKEAYIKARGEGLSLPLDQFDVSLAPNDLPALLGNRLDQSELSRWTFRELCPGPSFAAALAVQGPVRRLLFWEF